MGKFSKKTIACIAAAWAVLVIGGLSVYITLLCSQASAGGVIYSPLTDEATLSRRYSRLNEVLTRVENEYYLPVDEDALIQGAIDGMLASLGDPYTFYYTPEEMAASIESKSGVYEGVGMLVSADKQGMLKILRVFKDSPAQACGLRSGDLIIAVDGTPISAESSERMDGAVRLIRGEPGTPVTLTIQRKSETLTYTINRASVVVNRVEYTILEGNVGYIQLYEFFGNAVAGVNEAYAEFARAGVKGVIIDVRDNPGGLLDVCVSLTDLFLPEGLVVYTEDRDGRRTDYYSAAGAYTLPLVLLINESSASASEIFAASIQEYGVGTLVGQTTFGKGIVQTQYTFAGDGAGIQLTTSLYYTPSGRSIHDTGVAPDIQAEQSETYDSSITEPDMLNDAQLRAAYEALMSKISD